MIRPRDIIAPNWIEGQTLKVETVPTSGEMRCRIVTDARTDREFVGTIVKVHVSRVGSGPNQYRRIGRDAKEN